MLEINHLTKSYNGQVVLNDIHLSLDTDQIIGLAGPSGSGKSTLLRCIEGLESVDKGTVKTQSSKGFMFQDFQLFPHMTVIQNLTYAAQLKIKGDPKTKANELLEELNLSDKARAYPSSLSGGQKQRVALARSLMMNPQLMLLDEPTSGLDVATIDNVVDLLKTVKDKGVSMIIASHDLEFLSQVADRIILLKDGSVVVDLNVKETENAIEILKTHY